MSNNMTSSNNAKNSNLNDIERRKRNQRNYDRIRRKKERELLALSGNESANTTNSTMSNEGLYLIGQLITINKITSQ